MVEDRRLPISCARFSRPEMMDGESADAVDDGRGTDGRA